MSWDTFVLINCHTQSLSYRTSKVFTGCSACVPDVSEYSEEPQKNLGWLLLTEISSQTVATTPSMCGIARRPLKLLKCTESGNAVERDESSSMWKICLRQVNDLAKMQSFVMHWRWSESSEDMQHELGKQWCREAHLWRQVQGSGET